MGFQFIFDNTDAAETKKMIKELQDHLYTLRIEATQAQERNQKREIRRHQLEEGISDDEEVDEEALKS